MIYHYVTTVAILILFKMLPSTKTQQQQQKEEANASKQNANKEENGNAKQSIIADGEGFRQTCIDLTISSFQTMTYALTTAAILAVDFKIMPRKVAKTENYGISGMDYGVGMFVLCHAFKAVRRRFKTTTPDDSIYGYFAVFFTSY
jgi:phosphatidylinositol glycan class W